VRFCNEKTNPFSVAARKLDETAEKKLQIVKCMKSCICDSSLDGDLIQCILHGYIEIRIGSVDVFVISHVPIFSLSIHFNRICYALHNKRHITATFRRSTFCMIKKISFR
jgi:hypothetical protein